MSRTSRRFLILFAVIALAIAGYIAFWFSAIGAAREGFERMVAAERAAGHRFDYVSVEWGGFPIRLAADIKGLAYSAPGIEFEADAFRAEVLPWKPTHALVRADGHVRLALRRASRTEWVEFRPEAALASVKSNRAGVLLEADLELRTVRADGTWIDGTDFSFNAGRLQFDGRSTTRAADQAPSAAAVAGDAWQLAFSADALTISDGFAPLLGPRIQSVRAAIWAKSLPAFSRGVTAVDIGGLVRLMRESATVLEVARLDFDWGGVAAKSFGTIGLDAALRPEGYLEFKVTGISRLIEGLVKAGVLTAPPGGMPPLPEVPGGAPITLTLKDGVAALGPFSFGALAPLAALD
ncbi:MAG: DUF2125 domain-containing protein [Alphaproteobacteria bacterium]|nr:DUF2125 domain-containing protein [Alphaproteobacteria bacterium]